MPHIVDVECTLPRHYCTQEELIDAFVARWSPLFFNPERIRQFHQNVLVGGRYLALPMEDYPKLIGLKERNDAFIRVGLDLMEQATQALLRRQNLAPDKISLLMSSTVTGLAVPSLEARLMNRLPFAPHTKRVPLFGLGCLAGVAGIARVYDYLRSYPQQAALFMTVELCSLTLQQDDLSVANIVSSGLFGDGCGVVLMVGDEHPLAGMAPLKVIATESCFIPHSQDVMGFDIIDSGFKVVLGRQVPQMVKEYIPGLVQRIFERHGLLTSQLEFITAHPGGPKVLQALAQALEVPDQMLNESLLGLKSYGNMSSASVLFVLRDQLLNQCFRPGSYGVMTAMGPAFCAETVLLHCANRYGRSNGIGDLQQKENS